MGVSAGALVHIVLAALGASALVAASATAFLILKLVGAGYLLYLAVQMLRGNSARVPDATLSSRSDLQLLGEAALVNIFNPKVAVFMIAFLPQFTDPARGSVGLQIAILGLLFNLGGLLVNLGVGLFAGRARALDFGGSGARGLRYGAAALMSFLAVRLFFATAR